jgi:mono/diheme cytochrome c family protein
MKSLKIILLVAIAMLFVSAVFAMNHTPEDRGKTMFNDTTLGGGTAGKSCNTCHPDGKGLEGAGSKKMLKTPGGEFKTLEEAVNICITMALKGKAIDVKSEQMKDIVSYIKSLKPAADATPAKKKAAVGC